MNVRRLDDSPRNERGGQVSHMLAAPELGAPSLTVTWVVGEPDSQQPLHAHEESVQVYVIVRGRGLMIVDDEQREVAEGTAVVIPPGAKHAIRNTGTEPLEYVSATAPPFPAEVANATWRPTR